MNAIPDKLPACVLYILCFLSIKTAPAIAQPALKDIFQNDFIIGAALNRSQIMGEKPKAMSLVKEQFNSITPENVLKWESVHPRPDTYRFEAADRFVDFGRKHNMWIHGHTLVWYRQTPDWVFEKKDGSQIDRQTLLKRLKEHIKTVAGRYRGKIASWDVVNEAVKADGHLRDSKWRNIIGDDYIEKAFEYAHEAAPDAELYYNDFGLWNLVKRRGVIRLIKKLQAKGVPINGLGLQTHVHLNDPGIKAIEASLKAFSTLGIKLMISELDVDVLPRPENSEEVTHPSGSKWNPYPNGLPEAMQQRLANRYARLFKLFMKYHDSIGRVTFWGVNDGQSWLNHWPVGPRINYPLLFDRDYNPKPAFEAVINIGNE